MDRDHPPRKFRWKLWALLFLLIAFVIPLIASLQTLKYWRDQPGRGLVAVAIRVNLSGEDALRKAGTAVSPLIKGAVKDQGSSFVWQIQSGYHRLEFDPVPGTDLSELSGSCSKAVDTSFQAQGIRGFWKVCVVDDQGRVYWPKR